MAEKDFFKKFLVINPFGIGDVLFTTPVLRMIKENYPESTISYWCNERVEPIFKNNPYIDKIFALSRGDIKKIYQKSKLKGIKEFLRLLYDIKSEHFNLALDFSLDYRYSLLLRVLGVKRIIGFDYRNRGRFLTDRIKIEGYENKHVVEYCLDALKFLNIEAKGKPRMELCVSDVDKVGADKFLKTNNLKADDLLIGVAPAGGVSWGENATYLHWPEENFTSLCDTLINKDNAKIILFGSLDEIGICERVGTSLEDNVINTAGKLTLGQYVALFEKCKIAICNDAGPLHIAVALGLKTVSICGPVDEWVYGPYPPNQNHIVIKKDLTCRPCYHNFRFTGCANQHRCLEDITVDEVYSAVKRLMG